MLWWLNSCTDKMTTQSPWEGYIHWRLAFSSSSLPLSRTEVQGTLYHPHLIWNSSGLGDIYLFFIFTLEDISWLYPQNWENYYLRGRDPPCCLSQNRTICEHRILRRWLGPWAAGRRETKAEGCCFHLPPPNMTHLSLFVLNQSDPDYLEIDMSAGRWCGLSWQH